MTRLTVFAGVAVLALGLPAPAATHSPTHDAPASRSTLPALEHTPAASDRSTSAHPDGRRAQLSRDPQLPRVTPRVTLDPDDRAHRSRLDEALERFARAGLLLPDVEVGFSDSDEACHGHLGLFDPNSSPWRVDVCSDLEFVLTHELAHAWAKANLDEAERAAYVAHRGLPAWHGPDLHWRERGAEDAAFVMQQVLMAEHVRQDRSVWAERFDAFEQLTGRRPPVVAGSV